MPEFTGERVIPGEVDVDLFNEHMARYAFATRLARGKRVLDAGCGAGYGSAALAQAAASVIGVDVAEDAVDYAREQYAGPNVSFEQGSCTTLPFGDAAFDLVVAFEVIEHLEDWRGFLREAKRVLTPGGQFIVSTPNRLYYTESRGAQGANPFHVHEFEFEEFRSELSAVFPHVSMFLENHMEGVTFQPHEASETVDVKIEAGSAAPDESHFFIAVCAHRPQFGNPTFVYVPRAANVLRERERHIGKLEGELAQKDEWLNKAQRELAEVNAQHTQTVGELDKSNRWAKELDARLSESQARVVALQGEFESAQEASEEMAAQYAAKVRALEEDVADKVKWAKDLETRLNADVEKQTAALAKTVAQLHATEKDLEERTAWAQRLQVELEASQAAQGRLRGEIGLYQTSRWVRLGRKVGLGPAVPGE